MDVTVAICTWNRAKLLDQTLAKFREVQAPNGASWEIIVIDNNCTDDTPAVVAKHRDQLPLRSVVETKQGHSNARNRAIDEARGELIIWTDDDVLVPQTWLMEYLGAVKQFPTASFFGGPIRPWFECTPPAWIVRHLAKMLPVWALLDHGPEVRPLKAEEHVFGANFAFRTAIQRQFRFDPTLGRLKQKLTGSDEISVLDRARVAGHTGVWIGTAPVDHYIPADRLTTRYVWEWVRCASEVAARSIQDPSPRLFGAPRWLWRWYLAASAQRCLFAPFAGDRWLAALYDQAKCRGFIDQFQSSPAALPGEAP